MNGKFEILILILLIFGNLYPQTKSNNNLSSAKNFNLSLDEFDLRYQFMPVFRKGRSEEELKKEMMYSFTAEKLWARQAVAEGFDTSDVMKYTFNSLEKFFVRDALYKIEITDKASISEKAAEAAREKNKFIYDINFIFSRGKNEIDKINSQIKKGADFGEILKSRKEFKLQRKPYLVAFGDLEENIENAVFRSKPGDIIGPIASSIGWYIIRINSKTEKQYPNKKKYDEDRKNFKETIERRSINKAYKNYTSKLFKNLKINSDGYLFWSIADNLIKILNDKKTAAQKSVRFDESDFKLISENLGADTLAMPFIQIGNSPVSVKQFLYEFAFEGFYTDNLTPNIIRAKLKSRVKKFIEHEILAREAFRRGLDELPEVKMQLNIWRDYYLSQQLRNQFFDSVEVSDAEINKFINSLGSSGSVEFVKYQQLVTPSLETISKVFAGIEKGIGFTDLINDYSAAVPEPPKWTPVSELGELQEAVTSTKIGGIYGPIKFSGAYSIIKVLDKKTDSLGLEQIKKLNRTKLKQGLFYKKLKKMMIDKTVQMAEDQGLKVNLETLNKSRSVNQNMYLYKYFGFGGRSLAFPATPVFADWVQPWIKKRKSLP